KRNQGEELSGEGYHSRNRQMRMLAVVHNILVCYLFGRFATEQTCPLFTPVFLNSPLRMIFFLIQKYQVQKAQTIHSQ
ncbi:MAG: hypothetical protein NTW19_06850, partial [Planctomycetota bacterium]|nr:hypothetical protein [Planctomycetota bacterium]